jgi:hypothetical protein
MFIRKVFEFAVLWSEGERLVECDDGLVIDWRWLCWRDDEDELPAREGEPA